MKEITNEKCKECPHHKRLKYSGWDCCNGNRCEIEVREDEINRFQEWFLKTKQYCDYPEEIKWVMEEYREYIKGERENETHT